MTTDVTDITRMTARVAPHIDAIKKARAAGLTWGDIAARLGAPGQAARVRWAVLHCRYQAEQIPLPEPAARPSTTTTQPASQAPPRTQVAGARSEIESVINQHLIK